MRQAPAADASALYRQAAASQILGVERFESFTDSTELGQQTSESHFNQFHGSMRSCA
ncbi:hypothetical protein AMK01_PD00563 (plasmid) [Rhizobium sp. N6212]|nr:hypothetical protein AMK01_PD00563 [Rhizobium sp. N6212]ANL01495.1 hypothetical protein AMK00_PD00562 [Rhizobium sp. N621]ANL07618.1 hypothetical protein AMJ99_PD00564 [Rhizobium esperanzae]ANM38459.1 hypothetical protein AMK04_PD00565 [Rhizobium sp. N871]ANM44613.1 hypothetical protein AMK03_PE00565 [Rhizobium sp. N741]